MITLPLAPLDIVTRLLAALAAGFVIGLERESRGRAAGLRTYMLVCTAAAIAMIFSETFYAEVNLTFGSTTSRPDPTRVAQGILSGIGFLGAGTILRQGTIIRGLTTAAGLWYVTMLGIAFGSGYYLLGGLGLGIGLLTLFVLPFFERRVDNERYATVLVSMGLEGAPPEKVRTLIESTGATIVRTDLSYDVTLKQRTLQYDVRYHGRSHPQLPQSVVDTLLRLERVQQVKWTQQN